MLKLITLNLLDVGAFITNQGGVSLLVTEDPGDYKIKLSATHPMYIGETYEAVI